MPKFSGARLRRMREEQNRSREALAVVIRRSTSAVEKYEYGAMVPSADTVALMAAALGCPIVDLFEDGPSDRAFLTAAELAQVRARVGTMPPLSDDDLDALALVIVQLRETARSA